MDAHTLLHYSSSSESDEEILDSSIHPLFTLYSQRRRSVSTIVATALVEVGESTSRHRTNKRVFKNRRREEADVRLHNDYFSEFPVYNARDFRRRFRMQKHLFLRIVKELSENISYFEQKWDASKRKGFSPIQKCTAGLRMLAYDVGADAIDEYLRMGESTALDCLKRFTRGIVEVFGPCYLRQPNEEDINRIHTENSERGFPGMLGSIDCMHWKWKNCPTAWAGQFQSGHQNDPTIVLQAVASKSLWIWHAFFGVSGCNNDINVLEKSDLFYNFQKGETPTCHFYVNGNEYHMGYYLADGIYPPWAAFLKTIPHPFTPKHKNFAMYQEAIRKDIERAFGVLQGRWHIVRGSARLWNPIDLSYIMKACIIMHNMIVEDETTEQLADLNFPAANSNVAPPAVEVELSYPDMLDSFMERRVSVRNKEIHHRLQKDMVEHLWEFHGARNV